MFNCVFNRNLGPTRFLLLWSWNFWRNINHLNKIISTKNNIRDTKVLFIFQLTQCNLISGLYKFYAIVFILYLNLWLSPGAFNRVAAGGIYLKRMCMPHVWSAAPGGHRRSPVTADRARSQHGNKPGFTRYILETAGWHPRALRRGGGGGLPSGNARQSLYLALILSLIGWPWYIEVFCFIVVSIWSIGYL